MNKPQDNLDQVIAKYRSYLVVLADKQLDARLRHKIDASDIVQQTMLEAHLNQGQFQGVVDREVLAWLRKILMRNLLDAVRGLRRAKRDVRRERSIDAAVEQSSMRLERWIASDQSSASEKLVRQEEALRLAEAMLTLPESQREALMLKNWHHWTVSKIANHMGRSKTAVAGLLKRGLEQLRQKLSETS